MKERPILFSGPMVRAIMSGQKTQTRRVVKQGVGWVNNDAGAQIAHIGKSAGLVDVLCPYGQLGDRLWVRETWNVSDNVRPKIDEPYIYAADLGPTGATKWAARWRPSIHMPRAASRIMLEIVSVRVERLNEISESDALEEGITYNEIPNNGLDPMRARTWFRGLWESINGAGSWDANPWVWVIEFKRAA